MPQMLNPQEQRIAHGRFAFGIDIVERFLQIVNVIREFLGEHGFFVEVDDEDLVLRVGGLNQSKSRRSHSLALVRHAGAVIDDKTERDRHILLPE